jgi:trehalose/maltose hydrolase-like predicted phosphorylase
MGTEYPEKLKNLQEKINLEESEIERWKEYKDRIYSGYDPETKLYEQFKGFYDLEYIDLKEYEPRSVPMDVILGREKTRQTQVIKQPDVLMFMMLFGEKFSKEQVTANYDFYEKRCGHGSSLSPSIHSVMAARAGKADKAYKYFLKNAKIDIGDEFGNAAGGIHIGSLGGVWLSLIYGFAGMYAVEKGLIFDPCPPHQWESLEISLKWHGQDIKITLNHDNIKFFVTGDKNIHLSAGFDNWKEITPHIEYTAVKTDNKWEWKE